MASELLTLSPNEVHRLSTIGALHSAQLSQGEAASSLQCPVRTVRRLLRRWRQDGDSGLIIRRRGRRPDNAKPDELRQQVIELISSHFADHVPTIAAEALAERHAITLCPETVRQSKNLTFQLDGREHQLEHPGKGYRWQGRKVTVCEHLDDSREVLLVTQVLPCVVFDRGEKAPRLADEKTLNATLDKQLQKRSASANKLGQDRPWRGMKITPPNPETPIQHPHPGGQF